VERDLADNPHLKMINNFRGYHRFDITPKRWKTEVRAIDQVQAPGGKIRTLGRFVTTPDRPEVHRA
jgi:alkaline phosphatase D